jgi:hypothetical protein
MQCLETHTYDIVHFKTLMDITCSDIEKRWRETKEKKKGESFQKEGL